MTRHSYVILALLALLAVPATASMLPTELPIGLLAFDVFVPAGSGTGINAVNIYDLSGPVWGPVAGNPYASDSLVLQDATLTVFLFGGGSKSFTLGDLDPGELLDASGNPLFQVPSTTEFTSITLTATLFPSTFMLSDGATYTPSTSISVDLIPSTGEILVPGTDFAPIYVEGTASTVPEPGTILLFGGGLLAMLVWARARRQGA